MTYDYVYSTFRIGYVSDGDTGSQGHDGSVELATHLITGNLDYVDQSLKYDPAVTDHSPVNSYYLFSKPAWFGDRPWPPVDPTNPSALSDTNLPAGYRFIFGMAPPNQPPVAAVSATPGSGLRPLTVAFSSAGS